MSEYGEPIYDADDYDTVEAVAAKLAPIFALKGWTWDACNGVPNVAQIRTTLRRLYGGHAQDEPVSTVGSGRIVLLDENNHDGVPTLHEGVRVLLDLGELPPLRGDEL